MKKRLYRAENNKILGGVCGGLAEYFDQDPSVVRITFCLFCFLFGFGLVLYALMWFIVPPRSKVRHDT